MSILITLLGLSLSQAIDTGLTYPCAVASSPERRDGAYVAVAGTLRFNAHTVALTGTSSGSDRGCTLALHFRGLEVKRAGQVAAAQASAVELQLRNCWAFARRNQAEKCECVVRGTLRHRAVLARRGFHYPGHYAVAIEVDEIAPTGAFAAYVHTEGTK